jgi:photosystem II stability/assembly factor-like uncharacterized protein
MKGLVPFASFLCFVGLLPIQGRQPFRYEEQASGTTSRLRGVSAVDENVVWASGAGGTFVRTTDGGKTWRAGTVPGATDLDFRDVHGVDRNTAYLLSIGEGDNSRIYKTTDGGASWTIQFTNTHPSGFFDGIAFWDANTGLAFSDPVDGRILIVRTEDGGATWNEVPRANIPPALPGEAGFAASGSSIVATQPGYAWIGTGGGPKARVFRSSDRGLTWSVADTPVAAGTGSAGIFSLHFIGSQQGYAVGGDYQKEREANANFAVTNDGGRTWTLGPQLPGYRSAVAMASAAVIAVGPSGSDLLQRPGEWLSIGTTAFHAISFDPDHRAGWSVGDAGKIARWYFPR